MTHPASGFSPGAADPLAYDPAIDGVFPDQPTDQADPGVASSEHAAEAWNGSNDDAFTAGGESESYEPPSYADDSDS